MTKRQCIIYISGPYTASNFNQEIRNCLIADDMALKLFRAGFGFLNPLTNTYAWNAKLHNGTHVDFIEMDKSILKRCDAIILLKGWTHSKGATKEFIYAQELGLPVFNEEKSKDIIQELNDWWDYAHST